MHHKRMARHPPEQRHVPKQSTRHGTLQEGLKALPARRQYWDPVDVGRGHTGFAHQTQQARRCLVTQVHGSAADPARSAVPQTGQGPAIERIDPHWPPGRVAAHNSATARDDSASAWTTPKHRHSVEAPGRHRQPGYVRRGPSRDPGAASRALSSVGWNSPCRSPSRPAPPGSGCTCRRRNPRRATARRAGRRAKGAGSCAGVLRARWATNRRWRRRPRRPRRNARTARASAFRRG